MLIENLVFKGGGVKGASYPGCLKALEDKNLLKDVKRCAGTSAGAIVSFLISIGCNCEEITLILNNLDFKMLKTGFNPLRILTKFGLYTGDKFVTWLENILKSKKLKIDLTFKELSDLKAIDSKYKDLYVFAVSLNRNAIQGFSVDRTPDVKIVDAVRASMSIPMFFESWKIEQFPNEIFVDGGVSYNYPMSVFDNKEFLNKKEKINNRTLGFYLGIVGQKKENNGLSYNQPIKYVTSIFSTIIDCEIINFIRRENDVNRSVFIEDFGISAIDFDITKENVAKLYKSGYDSTIAYLNSKV